MQRIARRVKRRRRINLFTQCSILFFFPESKIILTTYGLAIPDLAIGLVEI